MAPSTRTVGIVISVVLSACFILAAFYLSGPHGPAIADAESTEQILKAYASLDTDVDGLFDWQESLYGADPKNPHSLDETLTDREMVDRGQVEPKFKSDASALTDDYSDEGIPGIEASSGSLTDRFARTLFENYLSKKGAGSVPTEDDLLAFIDASVDDLLSEVEGASRYNSQHILRAEKSIDSLLAYAVAAEEASKVPIAATEKSELFYFAEAVQAGDTAALTNVRLISSTYGTMAASLIKVPAPEKIASAHLRIVNALARMSVVVGNMGAFDTDPLLGLVGLSSYEETVLELLGAFNELYSIYASESIVIATGEPGARFYQVLETSHAKSKK